MVTRLFLIMINILEVGEIYKFSLNDYSNFDNIGNRLTACTIESNIYSRPVDDQGDYDDSGS